ncbi:16S rRNA (guanine(527)-N(7))-methyltransferase RsmG [Oleiagrimonas sp. C23AA]|uniref:16S rRNA (guanine(527)-N(7))-methyltransferase RsmG n=1 Tax=Oleiagrimonas sp. C23AA TaxID=2719047 RepID=UPI00197D92D7|nr:16S rRNA (guanine(527)-N(7))-methyltransferase RsmG [Oleiagrimonas sp. C23AA]
MGREQLSRQLDAGLTALGLELPGAARERLLDYQALLERWNKAYNLTAIRDPAQQVARHLLDSLSIAPYISGDSLLDIGSGAGLPGIPLALAAPERAVCLLDTNGKKARFLREAVRSLPLPNVQVKQQRVEQAEGQYQCITARAFASLADMLAWGGHLLAPGGTWLAMKGRQPDAELTALPDTFAVRDIHTLRVPDVDGERHLVVLERRAA